MGFENFKKGINEIQKTVKKTAVLGAGLLALGGAMKSNDVNAQTADDSLEVYNLGLEHVNKFHPDLGQNPDVKKFDTNGIEVTRIVDYGSYKNGEIDTLDKEAWTKNELEEYKKELTMLKGWKLKRDSINQQDVLTSEDLRDIDYIKFLNLDVQIPSKEEHINLLEESIKKGVYPVGLYNSEHPHDPAFQKPIITPKRKTE